MESAEMIRLCAVSEIPDGEVVGVEVDGCEIALYSVDGRIYATEDRCSHGDARLSEGFLEGDVIECPLHAGRFAVCDGTPCGGPVDAPVRTFRVEVKGGDVFLADPAELGR